MAGGHPLAIIATRCDVTLPPGQHAVAGFPRFGTHLHRPPPAVPADPVIEISGAVTASFAVPLAELAMLPRRELTADFHCVAGWSATNLHWEGVALDTFYRLVIEPAIQPGPPVTHLGFGGLDGFESLVSMEEALAEDVLVADRLDGCPLDPDHGAPARLVSPNQYGYVNTKHLCRIKVHTAEPRETLGAASAISQMALHGPLIMRHPRARVWKEERHPYLPPRVLRPVYRLLGPPIAVLCARGSQRSRERPSPEEEG